MDDSGRVDDNSGRANDELYPIGDVARRTGLSVSAIRFYSDAGVITPTGHTSAGYRLYDIRAIAQLELVRTLRDLDAGLEDIRKLLAEETTLRDLATAHLGLVERQLRRLQAKRAVLRTIVKQDSPAEQVTLMHKLAAMSDDDRNRLIDEFWDEISQGLNFNPALAQRLQQMRPNLPEEPTAEQLEAWIELADLLRNDEFRAAVRAVREARQGSYSPERAYEMSGPEMLERGERYGAIFKEAMDAIESGVPADSPRAQDIADRFVAATAEYSGDPEAEVRRRIAHPAPADAPDPAALQAALGFATVLGKYSALVARINGTPRDQRDDARERAHAARQWLVDAVNAAESRAD